MATFRSILFPVDFSDRCRAAAPFVAAMTQRFDADLTLMYVIELPVSVYTTVGYETILDLPAMRQAAQQQIDTFAGTVFPGFRLSTAVEEGQAAVRITEYAQKHGNDLIMMPTHGYGRFRSALLGSVTAKVLHDGSCPVWTDAHVDIPQARAQVHCKSMLCALDVKKRESVSLIRHAVNLAGDFGATLRLVHAVPAEQQPQTHFDEEFRRFLFETAREELRQMQAEAGTALQVCMEAGTVANVVRNAAAHHEADLIVIGRGVIHEPLGRLKTNTYAIIRESICPVLSW